MRRTRAALSVGILAATFMVAGSAVAQAQSPDYDNVQPGPDDDPFQPGYAPGTADLIDDTIAEILRGLFG